MKAGRPKNSEARNVIIEILRENPHVNRFTIIRKYKKFKGYGVGHSIIARELNKLVKEGVVEFILNNRTEKRTTGVFSISEKMERGSLNEKSTIN